MFSREQVPPSYISNAIINIKSSVGASGPGRLSANQIIIDQGNDTTYNGEIWLMGSSSSTSSAASLTKRGSGKLKLSNSVIKNFNSSPQIDLEGGVLEVDSNPLFVIGTTGLVNNSVFAFSGGTLKYGDSLLSSPPDFSNRFTTDNGQVFKIDTGNATVTFSSPIGGSGNSLEKLGVGTLVLNAANSYGGATIVRSGTLQVANELVIGSTSSIELHEPYVVGSPQPPPSTLSVAKC